MKSGEYLPKDYRVKFPPPGIKLSCHCELPRARALSVAAETRQCYASRLCPDKLRPAFRLVR